jgi:WD40 repeat protein
MTSTIFCDKCGAANSSHDNSCWACSQALLAPSSNSQQPATGPTFLKQRYRVLEHLGEGGFGKVYKVEDTQFANRLLAIKKLALDSIAPKDHQNAINSFKQEANILASLRHAHLPHIYEHFVDNHDYYLVMDFIEGETLSKYLQRRTPPQLPAKEVVSIGTQLASVLHYLHTRQPPVIFRDLKPENIMITPSDEIYLIDFGIARHFKPGQIGDTIRWGTREYAAPEQLAGQQTSALSDIYSLGVVLHQMLSGSDPLPLQLAPLVLSGPGQSDLANLVARMLQRDKQARPASMADVEKELEHIAQLLQQGTVPSRKQKQQAQRGKGVQSAPPKPPSPPPAPQLPLTRAPGELLYKYSLHSAPLHALSWSPDGSLLASGGDDHHIQVFQAATGSTITSYQQHTRAVRALAWSIGNRHLASAGNDHTVQIWKGDSGQNLLTYQGHSHWICALSWSPDGRLIASGDADNRIHIWNPHSGRLILMYQGHQSPVLALAFSPDTTLIASADESGIIHVWETASGKLQTILKGHRKVISSLAWSPDGKQLVSGSWDSTLQIWDVANRKQVSVYAAHQRTINAVAWSAARKLVASASNDKTVQIWEPQTCKTVFTYTAHTASINALAWSPDGTYLASAGDEAEVHIWRAP